MNRVIDFVMSREGRKWLYGLAVTILPLFVLYGAISPDAVPFWLAVAAAVLGVASPAMALGHLSPKPEAGPEASIEIPENLPNTALDLEG